MTMIRQEIQQAKILGRYYYTHISAMVLAPILASTGYRFDKSWRHAEFGPKAWFYRLCNTPTANRMADHILDIAV